MLVLRLSRVGKTKMPTFRLIVSEKTKDPWGNYLELLGNLDLRANPPKMELKADRIKYWLSKGAQPSPTVNNLLIDQKIIEGAKIKKVRISHKRVARMAEKKGKETPVAVPAAPVAPAA